MLYSRTVRNNEIFLGRKCKQMYEMAYVSEMELALDTFGLFIDKGVPGFVTVVAAVNDKPPLGVFSKLVKHSDDGPSWSS